MLWLFLTMLCFSLFLSQKEVKYMLHLTYNVHIPLNIVFKHYTDLSISDLQSTEDFKQRIYSVIENTTMKQKTKFYVTMYLFCMSLDHEFDMDAYNLVLKKLRKIKQSKFKEWVLNSLNESHDYYLNNFDSPDF